ncbi:MAG: serine/threonine-protein kinase [Pyrinomonadaceae bacterium]
MVDIVQSWLSSRRYAVLEGIAFIPRAVDDMSPLPLATKGEQGTAYYLTDENGRGWVLKKFFPEAQPDPAYSSAVQLLIPGRPGFESGFERQVLESSSVSSSAYADPEFQAWIDGAVLMPQVMSTTWADLAASIRDGANLSRVERLLLCQKLSEKIGWLESVGLAHRDLSSTNVLIDGLNIEVHLIDWDSLYHPTLAMPSNAGCGTKGYIAPFVRVGSEAAQSTWLENSDRFALAILNVELLSMAAKVPPAGELIGQDDIYLRSGKGLRAVRDSLRHTFVRAVELMDAAIAARSFVECPNPSDWVDRIETELTNSRHSTWEEENASTAQSQAIYAADYEPHFVRINPSAFVNIDERAFVKAPAGGSR